MIGYPMPQAISLCEAYDLLPQGGRVLCAVSGGADSVCLLHWLNGLRGEYHFSLTAAHYNHRLRGEQSLRDEEFVRSFVAKCCPDVELIVGCGDVAGHAEQNGTGVEETAREMRYAFLQETAKQVGAAVIATAHNAQDNAETLLMHLMRGSGLRGLTGIQPRRSNLVRPFLTTRREEIEEYLRVYGLPHVEDSTNTDERFARNRVRRRLLPLMEEMQPQFVVHAGKTARLLMQDEEYLTLQARQKLGEVERRMDGLSICADAVAHAPDPLAFRMVRLLLDEMNGGKCTTEHLLSMVELCRGNDPSAQVSLPGGLLARRVYDRMELVHGARQEEWEEKRLPLPGAVSLPWGTITVQQEKYCKYAQSPCSFYLSCAKVETGLTLRPRRSGDHLTRPGRTGRTLKKILIDERIPRHIRDAIPVLDCGGVVAAVAGLGPDEAFLPLPGERCWHIRCQPNTSQIEKGSL